MVKKMIVLLITALVAGSSSSTAVAPDTAGLTIVAQEGVIRTEPASCRCDAGKVDPISTPRFERHFTLRNETDHPIAIRSLRASCGCEETTLRKEGREIDQTTLAPGERVEVRVVVDMTQQRAGEKRVYVWTYGKSDETPIATIEIVMNIMQTLSFSPLMLNFGRPHAGVTPTLPLTITLDSRLTERGRWPRLVCNNPDVEAVRDGDDRRVEQNGQMLVTRRYRITLSQHVPIGHVTGALYLDPGTLAETDAAVHPGPGIPAVIGALRGACVLVTGEIIGSISAAPGTVLFGAVPTGKEAQQEVVLSAADITTLTNVTAKSESAWLSVTLEKPEKTGRNESLATRKLTLTLGSKAPIGFLQSRVIITTPEGNPLILSVIAEVKGTP